MKTALRTAALVLAVGCLAGVGARRAQAQVQYGVPYGPYSMTRAGFNRYAPVYYPRVVNNYGVSSYSSRPRRFPGRWYYSNRGWRAWGGRRR